MRTLVLSCNVSEIWWLIGRTSPIHSNFTRSECCFLNFMMNSIFAKPPSILGLSVGEVIVILALFILMHYQTATDGQTDMSTVTIPAIKRQGSKKISKRMARALSWCWQYTSTVLVVLTSSCKSGNVSSRMIAYETRGRVRAGHSFQLGTLSPPHPIPCILGACGDSIF